MSDSDEKKSVGSILKGLMLQKVPNYANKFFYSLGFLTATSLLLIIITGFIMVFFGPFWWLTNGFGVYIRSVHLWATQAFILFMMLHLLIVFLTSGYKMPRRLTWVLGSLMLFLAFIEAEFGYALRGDFSSQWRTLQASDLYNGAALGHLINNLNYAQIYGIHIIFVPLLILGIFFLHYLMVRVRGIAKPYKKGIKYKIEKANHNILFIRGGVLAAVILLLALIFNSPMIAPTTIKDVSQQSPQLMASTLLQEMNRTSGTATYLDNIQPYNYDTREVYIIKPYESYITATGSKNDLTAFDELSASEQQTQIDNAAGYFANNGKINTGDNKNPVIPVVSTLVNMGKSGLYEGALVDENSKLNPTYVTRFLADTGVLDVKAEKLRITTDQYGMVREETDKLPPGAWWLAPIGFMDHTFLKNDDNQDRDGAEILGLLFLLLVAFPYIPWVNRIPEFIGADKLIWRGTKKKKYKETVEEKKKVKKKKVKKNS